MLHARTVLGERKGVLIRKIMHQQVVQEGTSGQQCQRERQFQLGQCWSQQWSAVSPSITTRHSTQHLTAAKALKPCSLHDRQRNRRPSRDYCVPRNQTNQSISITQLVFRWDKNMLSKTHLTHLKCTTANAVHTTLTGTRILIVS